jgi:hypothetical protein
MLAARQGYSATRNSETLENEEIFHRAYRASETPPPLGFYKQLY